MTLIGGERLLFVLKFSEELALPCSRLSWAFSSEFPTDLHLLLASLLLTLSKVETECEESPSICLDVHE
jgi:hypothetical protein